MRIKITSKRQATFPRALCEAMHLEPGASVEVEEREVDGERVWVLSPAPPPDVPKWVGSLSRYAKGRALSMDEIRQKIMEAMARGEDLD